MHKPRTLLMALLAMLITAGGLFAPRLMAATSGNIDQEPNDTCATATNLGAISLPFSGTGVLDGNPYPTPPAAIVPNVDYYKITTTTGTHLQINLSGDFTVPGTNMSSGTVVGVYNSNCQQQALSMGQLGYPASVDYLVRDTSSYPYLAPYQPPGQQVELIIAVSSDYDYSFTNGGRGVGSYTLEVKETGPIGSVSGRLVDADTNAPITPASGYVSISLQRLSNGYWNAVGNATNDDLGQFRFDQGNTYGQQLAGQFRIVIQAGSYKNFISDEFSVGIGEDVTVGDLALSAPHLIDGIGGRVLNSKTGEPVVGAGISLSYCDGFSCYSSFYLSTDAEGRFSVRAGDGYQLYDGSYTINIYANHYEGYNGEEFSVGANQYADLGDIRLTPIPLIGSISGRLVDKVSGKPLSGVSSPYAQATVLRCDPIYGCSTLGSVQTDAGGYFTFTPDSTPWSMPTPGSYAISYSADQYVSGQTAQFNVGDGEHYNAGNIRVEALPVRIDNIIACNNISPDGGACRYSATITSGLRGKNTFQVWSTVSTYSPMTLSSVFQPQEAKPVDLSYGKSKAVSFNFSVPGNVGAYTAICVNFRVAKDQRGYYFNPLNYHQGFCVYKNGNTPFQLMSEEQSRQFLRQQNTPAARPNVTGTRPAR